jgi:ferric-dicitrate binding protein FerR (iron transport regulator)
MNPEMTPSSACPGEEALSALAAPSAVPTLDLARHLSECPSCRETLAGFKRLDEALRKAFPIGAACPSVEAFSSFLEGRLEVAEADEIRIHLSECPLCAAQADAFASLETETPELSTVSEDACRAVKGFANIGSPALRALPFAPAPAPRIAAPDRSLVAARLVLAVSAAAAGIVLAILVLARSNSSSGPEDGSVPSEFTTPSLETRIEPAPGEPTFPEMIEGEEGPIPPAPSEEPAEVKTPTGDPGPGSADARPEPSAVPGTAPDERAVERPKGEAPETPRRPETPLPGGAGSPSPSGAREAEVSGTPRSYTGTATGSVATKAGGAWTWVPPGQARRFDAGAAISPGLNGVGRLALQGAGEVDLRTGARITLLPSISGLALRLDAGEAAVAHGGESPLTLSCAGVEVVSTTGAVFDAVAAEGTLTVYVLEGAVAARCEGR